MGITIDEHIKVLESYGKGRKGFTGQPIDFQASINFAVETMCKYQKIEEIIADWKRDGGAFEMSELYWLKMIREAVEDGNNTGND